MWQEEKKTKDQNPQKKKITPPFSSLEEEELGLSTNSRKEFNYNEF